MYRFRANAIDCVIPGVLYLGNLEGAVNYKLLTKYGIRTIISVVENPIKDSFVGISYKWIQSRDEPTFRLDYYVHRATELIKWCEKPALVHCAAGMSRSPTIVMSYLILECNYSLAAARDLVQVKRPIVSVNPGFYSQLEWLDAFPTQLRQIRKVYFLILQYAGKS